MSRQQHHLPGHHLAVRSRVIEVDPAWGRRAVGAHPAPGELPRARGKTPVVERRHEPAHHVEDADLDVRGSVERERERGRGGEGIGPGMMTDARSVAVDGSGRIYVGEYEGGRIQVFDSSGKFITQWMVDTKMPLSGLAADRKGTVYVVQSGIINRYEGETGKSLGQISYPQGWGFDDIITTADGGLLCAWYKNRDDIVRFNPQGQVSRTIRGAISSVTDDAELDTRVANDGLGNVYALGTFNNAVFKFGPDGKYLNRFGGRGDKPGQFTAPSAIAVDGKGRVYVSDFKGIQVFDSDGRYLAVFKTEGPASGMVFDDKDELLVAARTKVIKFSLNQ